MAMACSLRSTGIAPASSLLRSSPPLIGASVLSASRLTPFAPFPLASPLTFRTRAWSSFAPPTCRMLLGPHQASPELIPEEGSPPVLTSPNPLSTCHQRFACARRPTAGPTFWLANTDLRVAASRSHVAAARVLLQSSNLPARYPIDIRDRLERKLLRMSAILLFVGSVGWCWPVLSELRSLILVSPAAASIHPQVPYCRRFNRCRGKADSEIGKLDPWLDREHLRQRRQGD